MRRKNNGFDSEPESIGVTQLDVTSIRIAMEKAIITKHKVIIHLTHVSKHPLLWQVINSSLFFHTGWMSSVAGQEVDQGVAATTNRRHLY